VLTAFLRIAGHLIASLDGSPFQQRRSESIPKSAFSVNAAVVRCNKKPGLEYQRQKARLAWA
jgi:hypothetical protein